MEASVAEPNWAPYQGKCCRAEVCPYRSLSDRIRYYWATIQGSRGGKTTVEQPNRSMFLVASQYLPRQYRKVRAGELPKRAEALIKDRIVEVYEKYGFATRPRD